MRQCHGNKAAVYSDKDLSKQAEELTLVSNNNKQRI